MIQDNRPVTPHAQSEATPSPHSIGSSGRIENFIGLLAGQTDKVAPLEEMNEAIANGWAGLSSKA
ncbi:MAG: hypothetical protein Q4D91_02960 [Lautropia sp.]|nr:hypothetical protein [Lautropia sp.]